MQISFPSPLMGSQITARVSIESQYWHILPSLVSETQIFSVLVSSLRLRFFSLGLVIETHTFAVSVSSLRLTSFQSRSRHWDLDISVSVSLLRLRHFQSRSRHWDSDLFSLGLVIETQTFSVSVLVSMIQIWSRWSLTVSVVISGVAVGYPRDLPLRFGP